VLETFTEILREVPKDERKCAFLHWKERCKWVAEQDGEFYPDSLNVEIL
jgi:hypothetical protein